MALPETSAAERPKGTAPKALTGLWPYVRPYRLQVILALAFLVIAAGATLLFPVALRHLVDGGLGQADAGAKALALRGHFLTLFGVAVVLGLASATRFYLMSWLGERVTADVRNAVYAHVLRQSPAFFETTQTGEVISRLTTDTTLVQTVVGSSFSMGLRSSVTGLGALAMLVWAHPAVMFQVLLVIVLVVLPAMWFGRRVRRLSRASQDRVADASAVAAEILNAIPVVQSYTAETRESARFATATEGAFKTAMRRSRARAGLVAFIIIANAALILFGLFQGTQSVLAGDISAGELGQAVLLVGIFASAVAILGEVYGDLLRAAGASERLMELLATESPVQSPTSPIQVPKPQGGSTVAFQGVSFRYPSRPDELAIASLAFEAKAGQTIALVGPSGAGKTTVFALLLRYYDPAEGQILVDGTPINQMALAALRERVGIVPQDPVIFSANAMENIRYGKPDASDDEVLAAARAAFADEFIQRLPEGYQTFLGERGVRLSGGQRQRIAIARAMLKNPPLLLLDEATSALDAQSERMVQAALASAMEGRTTLVIAHRLATIQKADRILVLDHGRLAEQGSHEELMGHAGIYAGLAALQFNA
ncbi:ABC transporter transmembrane domain-containing protein [Hydrogenophaga sp. 5NK40-0174]|uniref:ABC transporter transmembrane domain-containing protein n=1 Tax=Hydrogenophaga sp. 5NK40-0174 TaxID=3127649 RepID=UPI003104FEC4